MLTKIIGVHKVNAQAPCYLIETAFDTACPTYDWGEVTQEDEGQPRLNWQVAYDERQLNDTGIAKRRESFSYPCVRVLDGLPAWINMGEAYARYSHYNALSRKCPRHYYSPDS